MRLREQYGLPKLQPATAYRPAPARLPGARNRAQAMNDGFGAVPSLLDSLVFYPVWLGSQCVDMVSGSPLTNSANAVAPTDIAPPGEPAGRFSAASSQWLYLSSTALRMSDQGFCVAVWYNLSTITNSLFLVSRANGTTNNREYGIIISSPYVAFRVSSDGTSGTLTTVQDRSFGAIPTGKWILTLGWHDPDANAIFVRSNNLAAGKESTSNGVYSGSTVLGIGRSADGAYADGSIGPTPIWKRLLSDREQAAYYANGHGINISQFFLG